MWEAFSLLPVARGWGDSQQLQGQRGWPWGPSSDRSWGLYLPQSCGISRGGADLKPEGKAGRWGDGCAGEVGTLPGGEAGPSSGRRRTRRPPSWLSTISPTWAGLACVPLAARSGLARVSILTLVSKSWLLLATNLFVFTEMLSREARRLVPERELRSVLGEGRAQKEVRAHCLDTSRNEFPPCGIGFLGLALLDLLLVQESAGGSSSLF